MTTRVFTLIFSLAFIISTLTGCATAIDVKVPTARLTAPEAQGGNLFEKRIKGGASLALEGNARVEVASRLLQSPPVTTAPHIDRTNDDLRGDLAIGILDHLDAQFRLADDSPWLLSLKYQFLGAPRAEAQEGNLSAALTLGGGHKNESGTSRAWFSGETTVDYDVDFNALDVGLPVGYRFHRYFLAYAGPSLTYVWVDGNVTQGGRDYRTSGRIEQYGAHAGLRFDFMYWFAHTEWSYAHTHYLSTTRPGNYWALMVGMQL